jgi:hypothetical protein
VAMNVLCVEQRDVKRGLQNFIVSARSRTVERFPRDRSLPKILEKKFRQ